MIYVPMRLNGGPDYEHDTTSRIVFSFHTGSPTGTYKFVIPQRLKEDDKIKTVGIRATWDAYQSRWTLHWRSAPSTGDVIVEVEDLNPEMITILQLSAG